MIPWMRAVSGGVELDVLVVPRASKTEIVGEQGERLKVRLASPPVDGRANKALIQAVSKWTGIKRNKIAIAAGASGRRKRVHLGGATLGAVGAALGERLDGLT